MITSTQSIKAGDTLYWGVWEQWITVVEVINEWGPDICNVKVLVQDGRKFWVLPLALSTS